MDLSHSIISSLQELIAPQNQKKFRLLHHFFIKMLIPWKKTILTGKLQSSKINAIGWAFADIYF